MTPISSPNENLNLLFDLTRVETLGGLLEIIN